MSKDEFIEKALVQKWLVDSCQVVTPNYLNELRYRLAVKYKVIKNIEVECNMYEKTLNLGISLRKFRKIFTNKNKLKVNLLEDLLELIPGYEINISWV